MKKTITLLLFFSSMSFALAQNADSSEVNCAMASHQTLGLATGIHINKHSPAIEIGYFQHTIFEFPMTIGGAYTFEFSNPQNLIIAPKINYWINILFINAGFSIPWYFDLQGDNSLKIRPEIGLGYKNFKINYSVNLSVTNKNMDHIGKHFLSLNYYLPLQEI